MLWNAELESPFGFEEIFFSRTNSKGIIESGNSVFQRVSKYEWDEILKKPHSIIRHPKMPRGVFHLLWQTILEGKHVGAYVINQAKDLSYYWVFALVTPIDNGFLSVRLKPSSPIFDLIKDKYKDLLDLEKKNKISPKDSQEVLLNIIKELNFNSYEEFMTEALTQEIEYRQINLNMPPIPIIVKLREILRIGTELKKKSESILSAFRESSFIPINLEVQAAKIGREASTITVISNQYEGVVTEIGEELKKFIDSVNQVQEKMRANQFEVCNFLIQKEIYNFFKDDKEPSPVDKSIDMKYLEILMSSGIRKAKTSLSEIDEVFEKFRLVFENVKKHSTALEIVSITGKIEAAKIKQSSGDLLNLLNDLSAFKTFMKDSLKEVDEIGNSLMKQTRNMRNEI